jgi:hypothetical protein
MITTDDENSTVFSRITLFVEEYESHTSVAVG